MIKIPATVEGLPAIRQCLGEGINVNVTLLFGLPRYLRMTEAYIAGLEQAMLAGRPLEHIASVSQFLRQPHRHDGGPHAGAGRHRHPGHGLAHELTGQVAVTSPRSRTKMWQEIFSSPKFHRVEANGARPQRLLSASTSAKNPAYRNVKYVEALIGPDTVDTVPLETLEAFADHGRTADTLRQNVQRATGLLARLSDIGLDLDDIARRLEEEGIEKFRQPYNSLLATLRRKGAQGLTAGK